MAKQRLTKATGDYARSFFTEDGKHYRREHQEVGHAIRHVERIRRMHDQATRASNPRGWRHIGSIPMTMLIDWLGKHGYTIDQWARNDGGTPCPPGVDPEAHLARDPGVKSKFLRHFLSRDFSKLHNAHVTTKRESSQILVPKQYGGAREDVRRTESSDS